MNTLNKRQIIILAALAIPVIGLVALSFFSTPQKATYTPGNLIGKGDKAIDKAKMPANPQVVLPTFQEVKDNIQSRWKEAESMTPEKYAELYRKNPKLPTTLALYRERIKSRMRQLETMTTDQFDAEQRIREDHLRQRGIVPVPRKPDTVARVQHLLDESPAKAPAASPAAAAPAPAVEPAPVAPR